MQRIIFALRTTTVLLLCSSTVSAEVKLPQVFGDHMVLQRDVPLPVWGTASPGENVSITLGQEKKMVVADASGRWLVRFAPRQLSDVSIDLVVSATNTITITDILVGEVWICSGQSNMHWPLKLADHGYVEAASSSLPNLRLLNLAGAPYTNSHEFTKEELKSCVPEKYLTGSWAVSSPAVAAEFSAVGLFFGRELLDKLNVPIGLVHNGTGGTPTEAWISRETLSRNPTLKPLLDNWLENELVSSFCRNRVRSNFLSMTDQEIVSSGVRHPYHPGFMYESAIASLAPFAMRGVIWYQGESNTHHVALHDQLFPLLIGEWRRVWGQGDFPFLYVQLPSLEGGVEWPEFRESQRRALRIPNTGMAVTIDTGDPRDVHPREKREVAHRLALLARGIAYREEVEYSGPKLQTATFAGQHVRLHFSHTTGGLMARDNEALMGFELAGKDDVFMPAEARTDGADIVVVSSQVAESAAVRYGFAPYPRCNLVNGAGIPASPFRAQVN